MKSLRIMTFLILAAFAFCLPAIAQGVKPKPFVYKGNNGATGENREEFIIYITQRQTERYVMTGQYKQGNMTCNIRGTYEQVGRKLSGRLEGCVPVGSHYDNQEVSGIKKDNGDAFQLSVPRTGGQIVAWRNGVKSPTISSTVKSNNNKSNWAGRWVDGISVVEIKGSGNALSASWTYNAPNLSGDGSWSECKVEGNTANCDWEVTHDDDTKKGKRTGTLKVILSGDAITGAYTEKEPKWTYKPPHNANNVTSTMYDTAVHPINLKRK